MSGPKLELNSKPFVDAVKPALEALADLRAAVRALDGVTVKNLKANVQSAKTQLTSAIAGFEESFAKLPQAIEKSVSAASGQARSSGRKIGKAMGEGAVEEMSLTVRAARQKLQSQYEELVGRGGKVKPAALLNLRTQGVQLFPEDVSRLLAYKQSLKDTKQQSDLQANLRAGFNARASGSNIDPRTLLGLDAELMKKSAKASASVFVESFRQETELNGLRTASASRIDPRTLLGLGPERVRKSAKASAEVFKAAFAAEASASQAIDKSAAFGAVSARGQLSRATRVSGAMSAGMSEAEAMTRYGEAAVLASRDLGTLQQRVNSLSTAKQGLLERSREIHSAFRGIAGAAGALFLTYGELIPLTTAFFVSTAVKRAVSEFADLEFQLKFVQAAAEDYSVSVQEMSSSVTRMAADAGKTPGEAARGLRLLAQSGLSTSQSLQALPGIMRTATIGELDMAEAATTLTGAMYAFGLNVGDIERIGDVFAKAGALSNTSVAQISESMKQASSIAQEYKLSIEDVTTTLVALAKRNITGSMAGTAVRNMYKDLAAPKGGGKEVARILGVSLFGEKGKIKDMFTEYLPELQAALNKLTHEAQVIALDRIANERGGKALSALLGLSKEELESIRSQLNTAAGFTRNAVNTLNDTLQRDYEKMKSTLSASLIQAGSAGAAGMRSAVQSLTEVIASPEFIGAVSNLVKLTAMLAKGLVWVAEAAVSPVAQFTAVAASVAMMTGGFARFTTAGATLAADLGGVGTAATFAGTALMTMTRAFAAFAVITTVIGLLGLLYDKMSEKDAYGTAIENLDKVIRKQREYRAELDDTIRKQKEAQGSKGGATPSEVNSAQRAWLDQLDKVGKAQKDLEALGSRRFVTKSELLGAQAIVNHERAKATFLQKKLAEVAANDRSNKNRQAEAVIGAMDTSPRLPALTEGSDPLSLRDADAERAANKARAEAAAAYRNALKPSQNLRAKFDNENKVLDMQAKADEARLQHGYNLGLTSFEDFEDARDKLQKEARDKRVDSLNREIQETQSAISTAEAAAAAANKKSPGSVTDEQLSSDVERLRNQIAAGKQEVEQLKADQAQADLASIERRSKGLVDATKSAADLLLVSKLDAENQKEASKFRRDVLGMSEVAAVRATAEREVTDKFLKEELRLRAEIEKYKDADPKVAAKARKQLEELQGQDPRNLATSAGDQAVAEFRATKIADTAKELKSGIASAIVEGGESGAEALRNTLQNVFIKKPLTLMLEAMFDPAAKMMSAGLGSLLSVMGLRAGGGHVSAGNRYLVGENGPELLDLEKSGRVYNANETRQMLSTPQGSGQSVVVHVAPQISIDSRSDAAQVQQLVARGVKEGNKQMVEQLKAVGVIR